MAIKTLLIQDKLEDIRSWGAQSLAYSAMQKGIKEFRHPAFEGFIAYTSWAGIDYVLSDPITPRKDFLKAALYFLEKDRQVVFCQISENFASQLNRLNFKINGLGVEHILDLEDFEVGWKNRKRLKSYLSSLSRQGFLVSSEAPQINEVERVNQEWLKAKSRGHELCFMARPFAGLGEPDVRYFFLVKDGQLLGFASFDPLYSTDYHQGIIGYGLQHLRVADTAPSGAQDYLILKAIFDFKEQGIKKFSLGISPLYQRENGLYQHSHFAEAIFEFLYRTSFFYQFRSQGQHKEQYKANKMQTYVATRRGFSLKKLFGILRVNALIRGR